MRVAKSVARKNFSQVLNDARRGARVKITHYGRTSAYVVSREDMRKLEACERSEGAGKKEPRSAVRAKVNNSRTSARPGRRMRATAAGGKGVR